MILYYNTYVSAIKSDNFFENTILTPFLEEKELYTLSDVPGKWETLIYRYFYKKNSAIIWQLPRVEESISSRKEPYDVRISEFRKVK